MLDLERLAAGIVDKQLDLGKSKEWLEGNNGADQSKYNVLLESGGIPGRGDPSCPLPTVLRVTQQAVLLCKKNQFVQPQKR